MTAPRLGWYGDDFTGATDTLAEAAAGGLRALLFLGVPTSEQLAAAGPLDAVGIAGASRTMAPEAMARELGPVGRFFAELGVAVLHYKCCSTFDSAPGTGSLGAAIRALKPSCPNPLVAIVGGQPNLGRYCAFSTLFAAAGSGGAVHRLDRHPTMSRHPVTPMDEADLRLHLARQDLAVAGLHYPAYADEAARLDTLLAGAPDAVLFDVAAPEHLAAVGRIVTAHAKAGRLLAVGPSGVTQALLAGAPRRPPRPLSPARGPVLALVGSLSPVSRGQAEAARSYARVAIDGARLVADPRYAGARAAEAADLLGAGRPVLLVTAPDDAPDGSAAVLTARLAHATADLFARTLALTPVRRAAVAGGDTSSRAAASLGLRALAFETTLGPGVTLCGGLADDPRLDGIELVLKGGQMGGEDIFERLIAGD